MRLRRLLTIVLVIFCVAGKPAHALEPATPPSVLLVTDASLAEAWRPFAAFKTSLGLPTRIVTVQAIDEQYAGEDIQARIRACVLEHIEQHGTRYIILGGDSAPGRWPDGGGLVPDRDTPHLASPGLAYRDIPTDLYYLSPGDKDWDANNDGIYGDWRNDMGAVAYTHPSGASLGRIPVRTAEDVAAYTDKVIAYETNYPDGDFATTILYTNTVDGSEPKVRRSWDDYLSKVWDAGSALRFFHTDTAWDERRSGDYALTAEHWRGKINERVAGKMHMHGHGMPGYWVLEDDGGHTLAHAGTVDRLTNEDAYLVMTTVSCFTGMYDAEDDPTIVETMLRTPKKGAVAVVSPSREGVPIFHNPRTDFRLMVTEGKLDGTTESMTRFWMNGLSPREDGSYRTIGEAFAAMKAEMTEHAERTAGYHWCQCELNLLGDPTLGFRAKTPLTPTIDTPAQVRLADFPQAGEGFAYPIQIQTGLPEGEHVRVCFAIPGKHYSVTNTSIGPDGTIRDRLLLAEEFGAGEMALTISGPNLNAVSKKIRFVE